MANVAPPQTALAAALARSKGVRYDAFGNPIQVEQPVPLPGVPTAVTNAPPSDYIPSAPAPVQQTPVDPNAPLNVIPQPGDPSYVYGRSQDDYVMPTPQNIPDNTSLADRQAIWGPTGQPPVSPELAPQFELQQHFLPDQRDPRTNSNDINNWIMPAIGTAAGAGALALALSRRKKTGPVGSVQTNQQSGSEFGADFDNSPKPKVRMSASNPPADNDFEIPKPRVKAGSAPTGYLDLTPDMQVPAAKPRVRVPARTMPTQPPEYVVGSGLPRRIPENEMMEILRNILDADSLRAISRAAR